MATPPVWQNRIIGTGTEAPDQLLANPRNWRVHPAFQQESLLGVLSTIGWVQDVIVNQRTGFLVDGHLRVVLALRTGQPTVPVKYVDLSDAEEALILAALDPLSALAVADAQQLDGLLRDCLTEDAATQALLARIAADAGLYLTEPGDAPEPDPAAEPLLPTAAGQTWRVILTARYDPRAVSRYFTKLQAAGCRVLLEED